MFQTWGVAQRVEQHEHIDGANAASVYGTVAAATKRDEQTNIHSKELSKSTESHSFYIGTMAASSYEEFRLNVWEHLVVVDSIRC